jgi:hypothetical protein
MRRPTRDRRSKAEKAAAAAAANNKGATDHITASGDTEEVRIYIVFGVIVSCLCLCMPLWSELRVCVCGCVCVCKDPAGIVATATDPTDNPTGYDTNEVRVCFVSVWVRC